MTSEAVEKRRCHLCIAEDACPFGEAQVGGDDDAGAFIQAAEEMEEEVKARYPGWKVVL